LFRSNKRGEGDTDRAASSASYHDLALSTLHGMGADIRIADAPYG
jgi:hypothetical protein